MKNFIHDLISCIVLAALMTGPAVLMVALS
jgi:hypothetical protein